MLEVRSAVVADAITVAVGLSIAAAPAPAAGTVTPATSATAKKASTKEKATKKSSKKQAAAPKTVTACVNERSGTTKVLLGAKAKKKCAKGWTKMTWNVAGPAGRNGVNGVNGTNGASGAVAASGARSVAAGARRGREPDRSLRRSVAVLTGGCGHARCGRANPQLARAGG
jgi:hypothetical protein